MLGVRGPSGLAHGNQIRITAQSGRAGISLRSSIPSPHDLRCPGPGLYLSLSLGDRGRETMWLCLRKLGTGPGCHHTGGQLLTCPYLVVGGYTCPSLSSQPDTDFSTCQVGPGPQILDDPQAHLLGPDGLPKPAA